MALARFGRYRLERPLAQGGMAEIFLARQSGPEGFEKLVVIKRVLPHLATDAAFRQMFLDEARIVARLNHPGIVQLFDFGDVDGRYFIAMEYLVGEDLASLVKAEAARHSTVPPPVAARILSAACDALHYAHTFVDAAGKPLNIVHRDISPSNLFLTYVGAVKVLDFGLAKAEGRKAQTGGGVLKGKFLYMSPEQIHGEKLDGRSDVFALGAVLHEILSGQPTFLRDDVVKILKAITDEPILPLSDLVPGIAPELDQIVLKALDRDRNRRFRSALELRRALDAWLAKAAPGSPTAQLQDYVHGLIPEAEIQRKGRPLADVEEAEEFDESPTHRRIEVSQQALSGEATDPSLPPIKVALTPAAPKPSEVDQVGATQADLPPLRPEDLREPGGANPDGPPTDRGLAIAPDASRAKTQPHKAVGPLSVPPARKPAKSLDPVVDLRKAPTTRMAPLDRDLSDKATQVMEPLAEVEEAAAPGEAPTGGLALALAAQLRRERTLKAAAIAGGALVALSLLYLLVR